MLQAMGYRSYLEPVELHVSKLTGSGLGEERKGEDKANESFGEIVFCLWFVLVFLFFCPVCFGGKNNCELPSICKFVVYIYETIA